jgi:hypothetical protein
VEDMPTDSLSGEEEQENDEKNKTVQNIVDPSKPSHALRLMAPVHLICYSVCL